MAAVDSTTRARKRWALLSVLLGLALGGVMIAAGITDVSAGSDWPHLLSTLPPGHANGNSLGRPDAPLRMVLYADFQCGHCERLHREVEPELVWRYVATGKARLEEWARQAQADGVKGVPALFVGGRKLEGEAPVAAYSRLIEEELAR